MQTARIRPIAIALIRRPHDGAVLASYGEDNEDGRRFYRPLGGGIEFGETSEAAVRRELLEELGAEIETIELLRVTENIFIHRGQQGHEVVFIWECRLRDETLYRHDEIAIDENGVSMVAHWVHLHELRSQGIHFYPEELARLLNVDVVSASSFQPSPSL
jgi:ADP-ribose pyrophosphatase YjhB (NUDIX family)